jgi:CRP/FNR family transcriptional regulator
MHSPYGLDIIENCLTCKMRADHVFCDLPPVALQTFEHIKSPIAYPKGSILFLEGQAPRGIFVLCKGTSEALLERQRRQDSYSEAC